MYRLHISLRDPLVRLSRNVRRSANDTGRAAGLLRACIRSLEPRQIVQLRLTASWCGSKVALGRKLIINEEPKESHGFLRVGRKSRTRQSGAAQHADSRCGAAGYARVPG